MKNIFNRFDLEVIKETEETVQEQNSQNEKVSGDSQLMSNQDDREIQTE